VPLTDIHSSWQKGKMTDEDAKSEILNSKAVGAERTIRVVDFHVKAQKEIKVRTMSKHVLAILKSKEKNFGVSPSSIRGPCSTWTFTRTPSTAT